METFRDGAPSIRDIFANEPSGLTNCIEMTQDVNILVVPRAKIGCPVVFLEFQELIVAILFVADLQKSRYRLIVLQNGTIRHLA